MIMPPQKSSPSVCPPAKLVHNRNMHFFKLYQNRSTATKVKLKSKLKLSIIPMFYMRFGNRSEKRCCSGPLYESGLSLGTHHKDTPKKILTKALTLAYSSHKQTHNVDDTANCNTIMGILIKKIH